MYTMQELLEGTANKNVPIYSTERTHSVYPLLEGIWVVTDEIQRSQSDVLQTLCIGGLGTASHVIDDVMHALDTNEYTYFVPPQTSEKTTVQRLLHTETSQICLYPAPRGFQGHDVSSLEVRENEV